MMRRKKYTVAAVLLLCAVSTLCSGGAMNQNCVSSWKVNCFHPAVHLNASDPVGLKVSFGQKLDVSLVGLPDATVCQWSGAQGSLLKIEERVSTVIPQALRKDSGTYNLGCESLNGTSFSITVDLHVGECPSKPQLTLDKMDNPNMSPHFKCKSDGSPRPRVQWSGSSQGKRKDLDTCGAEISVTTTAYYDTAAVMCCASNDEGEECTQLCDLDLEADSIKQDEISDVIVSPGEPLILRCRRKFTRDSTINWQHEGKVLVDKTNKYRIIKDKHYGTEMLYAFIASVAIEHNGSYTCYNSKGAAKSVDVHVTTESFLSSQLPKQVIVNHSNSCLEAEVSYHPVLHHCYWEAPDGSLTKCSRNQRKLNDRTVKYCNKLQSGEYMLHLEAGGKKETKKTAVCVVEEPDILIKKEGDNLSVETKSVLPAKTTWMSSSFSNSSETNSSWEVIHEKHHTASDGFCNKKLNSFLKLSQVPNKKVKFCLTNQAGNWCSYTNFFEAPVIQAYTGHRPPDHNNLLLRIGVCVLLLALLVVLALLYYVKKKKPKYQPQLQMIQMVGPNDNDYIYINFKDFNYDKKWEFPRENLELGKELGSGAFGMVVQATAYGIDKPGVSQQVAVKMLKEKHQSVEKEALMSELKMLTHIGQHTNIVNLLGACTETGPIYLIFQYCCYGDLLNYLKKSGDRYHKCVADAISRDRFSSLYHNVQPKKNSNEMITTVDNYMPMQGTTTRGQENIALITFSSNDNEEMYESEDDQTEQQALTFDDLLSFAFQVAKGMEFLSSKNCIHRDLAARNVLVTKGRLVKIGDFGLARDIDNDSNYVVRGNVRLPVKWMAPESIFQGMYTMKSDVWAYGILLWEIFSLGVTPYPGIKVDHSFYTMIERGFKMECPYYANESVYSIMCKCWALDPNNRPSFSKLVDFMSDQLMDMEEKLYQNMHDQNSSDYQNASTIVDISASVKENGNQAEAVSDYREATAREESNVEALKSESAVGEEEEPLKPSVGE
ncbi:PREDICTED: receptor-type tyrosine-protein kinase FLT3-like [Cyprinodon variegatus]|uniref:receptor protein-tyrosine kinase n=1 Tax=Cyprinodon variegatus TaxID=28743 RepID=A0A3Q2EEU6_CYPVA|nr:PREDICTED: receptor-type tyrosine-protein kinase FLT3-like [Cyprinodon variegatus]